MIHKQSTYFSSTLFPTDRYLSGFGTKVLGDGRDSEVIKSFLDQQGKSNLTIVVPKQTHSTNVAVFEKADSKSVVDIPNCDAIVTRETDVLLTCITADCVPMIFADDEAGVIGISHQGWKGTLGRLPAKVIETMLEQGATRENIKVAMGPAINDCCYEIFGERLDLFQQEFDNKIFRISVDKYFLNLYKANYQTLQKAGIVEINIDFHPFCTSCDARSFYSYHRQKPLQGEILSFIGTL